MNDILKAVILGIVEGITEFLPISSTGHLIIVNQWISFEPHFTKMFDIIIQLGAIFSVVVYFRKKLFDFKKENGKIIFSDSLNIWKKAIVGVIPALIFGALFGSKIEEILFNPVTVSIALLIGGIFLIIIESRKSQNRILNADNITYKIAIFIGLFQCLAMIPGTSRSAVTIIGAMLLGCSRLASAEFSFFLAIPTMFAASAYSLMKIGFSMTGNQVVILVTGFIVSFIVAFFVIAGFMKFISTNNFKAFGIYRIILAIIIISLFFTGIIKK